MLSNPEDAHDVEAGSRAAEAGDGASAAIHAAILGQLAEGVIVTDAQGRITLVNEAAAAIHGVARLDVEPAHYSETYHLYTEDGRPHPPLDLPLARAVRGETVRDARWRIRRPDGLEVLAIGNALPLRGPDGRQAGAVLTLRDDTARDAAEQRLRESETRLRTLADNLPSGITYQVTTKADGTGARFLYLARAHERLTGLPNEAVMADAYLHNGLMLPEHLAALDAARARALEAGTPYDVEVRFRRADTRALRWARIISAPRPATDGSVTWDGLMIDITDQKRAEAQLRDLNATLSQRVAERTREAESARELAEAGSQAKSDFLAAMSHEIRTPLSGILGYTDLLLDASELSPRARLHAECIRSAGAALLTIVNDVLDFSRIEAGRVELMPEPFALRRLAEETLAIVQAEADAKGLVLALDTDAADETAVIGDRDRLRQVLLNLVNNAIKFTHAGSVRLRIETSVAGDAARLRFSVRDTGIGIPASKQHLLFERFRQIDGTIRREFGGTGLGLAISKQLVELMGGTIGLDSEAGQGSTFWFALDLPLGRLAHAADIRAGDARFAPRRLLLVDDVALNRELARSILTHGGHEVDVVGSGPEAIAAVQACRYDLVLMDIQMPGMDGIRATQAIRALDHPEADVPIVAMTANVLPDQVAACRAAGMQDHVGKPFRRDVLFSAIARCARSAEAGEPAADCLDRDVLDAMAESIGPEGTSRLLAGLEQELRARFGPDGTVPARDALARDAHAMVAATEMLGFGRLSRLCREAEAACLARSDHAGIAAQLMAERQAVLDRIAVLRAA